ncbi:transglycosylase SLT domain-containing protein [Brochothrix thermosphacta]|uniref:transglycosylase SLT domain-containing protein n=1 Tax=Brochothrix thermosphacta TaxID=2756 RepID=UPI002712CF4D|nr:transglycosylase SLT domain-containing protein [Brochothrix thermosphacta]MDO7864900.1 transglycosylase SLT domain-containing protein [Brochothrix thermosphacta]
MNNFSTAQDASAAATGSAGSAMKEQQTYMMSYEAKINEMKNAWTEFALAFEKSIGGTLIMGGTAALKGLTEVLTGMTDTFGALPTTVGIATTALLLFSKTGRDISSVVTGGMLTGIRKIKNEYQALATTATTAANAQNTAASVGTVTRNLNNRALGNKSGTLIADQKAAKPNLAAIGTGSLSKVSGTMTTATTAATGLTRAFTGLRIAGVATMTTLGSALLPLAAITALSWGIQKLIGVYQKKKALEADLEKQQKTLISGYKSNSKAIDENVKKYERLSVLQQKGSLSVADQQELVSVQNQLNQVMPSLTDTIDSQGNAHLKSTEAVKEQIKYIKDLGLAQAAEYNDKKAIGKIEKQTDALKELAKETENLSKKNNQKDNMYRGDSIDFKDDFFNDSTDSSTIKESVSNAVMNNKRLAISNALKEEEVRIGKNYLQISKSTVQLGKDEQNILNKTMYIKRESLKKDSSEKNRQEYIDQTVEMTETLSKLKKVSGDSWGSIKSPLESLVGEKELSTPEDLQKAYDKIKKIQSEFSNDTSKLDENGALSAKSQSDYRNALEGVGLSAGEAAEKTKEFSKYIREQNDEAKRAAKGGLKDLSKTQQEYLDKLAEGMDVDEVNSQKSTEDIIAGVSADQVDKTQEMISVYQQLNNQEKLTEQQQALLSNAMTYLNGTYGTTNSTISAHISSLEAQAYTGKVMQQAATALADGQITDSQRTKMKVIQDIQEQIKAYQAQIDAANIAKKAVTDAAQKDQEDRYGDGMTAQSGLTNHQIKATESDDVKKAKEEIDKLSESLNTESSGLQSSLDETTDAAKESSSSTSDAKDSIKEYKTELKSAIFVEDTYAKSLERVNALITRNNSLRGLMANYSKSYQKSLKAEIKLQESQLKLQQAQSKSLASQIKNGTINEYGVIDTSSSYSTYGSNGNGSTSANFGSGFTKTSGYGGRNNPTGSGNQHHNGIDYAAAYGTGIKAQQGGKVTYAGYSESLGNYVQVEIEKGVEVIYGHMSKILTKTGEKIAKDTVIGQVGSTGDSTGNHVHYAVKKNGNYVNPDTYKSSSSKSSGGGYSGKYSSEINAAAKKYGVDPNLVAAIMKNESTFDKNAKSDAGAIGLMQLMPSTAAGLGVNPYSVQGNVEGGTKYISQMLKMFDGDMAKAVAAYNAGPGNVQKYGGIPPIGETQNYVKNVLKSYSGYGGSSSGASSDGNTTVDDGSTDEANRLSSISGAKSNLQSLESDIIETRVKIQELKDALAQSQIDALANEVEKAQHKADMALKQAEFYDPTSSKYRAKQEQAAKYYNEVISKKEKELKLIKQLQKSGAISKSKKAELESSQRSLELDILTSRQDQQEAYLAKINSRIDEYQKAIDKTADAIQKSASLEAQSPNSQAVKNKAIKDTLKAYKEQEKTIKNQLAYVKSELKNNKLSAASKQELIEKQRELTSAINDSKQAQAEYRRSVSDSAISAMKDAIQQQSDAVSAMYDKEIEDAQKANEKKQSKYDKDVTAYKKAVQEKLDALDDASSSRSFTKQMEKLQKEESTLRQQINALSLDDSAAAQAKRKELQDQLDSNKDSQEDLKYDRDKELQSQALNDAADEYEETINDQKETEQAALDAKVEALNKDKEDALYQFQEVLNNTAFWEKMADSITKGSTKEATKMMNDFSNSLKGITGQTAQDLGISSTSIKSAAKALDGAAKNLAALSGNSYKNNGKTSQADVSKNTAWGTYLSNTNEMSSASGARKKELEAENAKLAKKYGFLSGSYDELSYIDISKGNGTASSKVKSKAFSEYADNARKMEQEALSTASYNKLSEANKAMAKKYGFPTDKSYEKLSKMKVYHTGGIVGQDANFVNGIAMNGLSSNEQIAKLLKGEVVLSKTGIANVADSMRNLSAIASIVPNISSKHDDNNTANFSINIDNVVAKDEAHAKKYANSVATEFMDTLRSNGMKI